MVASVQGKGPRSPAVQIVHEGVVKTCCPRQTNHSILSGRFERDHVAFNPFSIIILNEEVLIRCLKIS